MVDSGSSRLCPVFREVISYPKDSWEPVSVNKANKALQEACVDYRGWPFVFYLPTSVCPPKHGDNIIEALNDEPFDGTPIYDSWAFDYSRGIFYAKNMTTESSLGKPDHFDPSLQVSLLAEAFIAIGRLFDALNYPREGELDFVVRYRPMKDVKVATTNQHRFRLFSSSEYIDDLLTHSICKNLNSFLTLTADTAATFTMELVHKMGYRGNLQATVLQTLADKHLAKGHQIVR